MMIQHYPRALFMGGVVDESTRVVAADEAEETSFRAAGYRNAWDTGDTGPVAEEKAGPACEPVALKRGPGRPRKVL